MKKYLYLATALVLALMAVITLISGIGKAQAEIEQAPEAARSESAPTNAAQPQGEQIEWPSSAPIPENTIISSPPDVVRADALDAEITAAYNSSWRVSGAVLRPRESDVEWSVSSTGGCIYASGGDQYTIFNTPVSLPQGSVVKYFRMYYNDANASTNTYSWLTVYDLYGDIVKEYGISSSGTGEFYATTVEITETIDYNLYSYVINWRPYEPGSDMQICGFRIYYDSPPGAVYMPLITNDE